MARSFLLNGRPVEFDKLISAARNIGYDADVLTTAGAIAALRADGQKVEENEPPRPVPAKS